MAKEYFMQWNYPMCLGVIDGKRILISKPPKSGSDFYDYKGHFSVILLTFDANYNFWYFNVGGIGRWSDGGVWNSCSLKEGIEAKMMNIPESENIPFSDKVVPYTIVGDDAFPLKPYFMKPYPGKEQRQYHI